MKWFLLWVLLIFPMKAAETVGYLLRSGEEADLREAYENWPQKSASDGSEGLDTNAASEKVLSESLQFWGKTFIVA